jgi:hypothetical protein
MSHLRWFCVLLALSLLGMPVWAAQTDDASGAIQNKLNAQFKLTRATADRSDIVTAGDVVELQKNGLIMYAVASPFPPANSYKNGKIGQGWGGFGKDLLIGMAAPDGTTAADYPHRAFVAGEKCWVTSIQVQKDGVLFQLFSDPYDDVRYYANFRIPFPNKKQVPAADAFLQTVAEVLTVVPPDPGAQQAAQPSSGAGGNPAAEVAPVAVQAIAPPPPPADAPPPTVWMGESKAEVIAAFGTPSRRATAVGKEIFMYKDMKVTFTGGKVTDVD